MAGTRASLSISLPNEAWLQQQIDSGEFASRSEVVNDLIRKAREKDREAEDTHAKLLTSKRYAGQHGSVYLVTLHTKKFLEMKSFFAEKLAMSIISENGEFVEFASSGVRLALVSHESLRRSLSAEGLTGKRSGSSVGIGFGFANPKDVDLTWKKLVKNGVTPVAPPKQQPWGEYTAFFADPDGNIHELAAQTD